MSRDYSKYNVDGVGENLNKRKLVLKIVQDYVKKNTPSYDELKKVFPDDLQGSKGMIRNVSTDKYDANRFFYNDQINVQDQICVVSNQWGTENTQRFIDYATELGYSINKVEGEKSNFSKSSSEFISVDIELREDDQYLICSLKNYKVNTQGDNSEIKKMYDSMMYNFDSGECTTLISSYIFEKFERDIYYEFLTNSQPSDNEFGATIDDMKKDNFDWWKICPHLVVTRIGEIDLNPIVNLDEDDEDMLDKCCKMLNIDDDNRDYWEDYISDYMVDQRFSVVDDLFKEVVEEL
tara:strand:- start:233 stop:1111 length:879 start_codon:yes stop_codon:yes gene_type:complete